MSSSFARYTSDIPPRPRRRMSLYRPSFVPSRLGMHLLHNFCMQYRQYMRLCRYLSNANGYLYRRTRGADAMNRVRTTLSNFNGTVILSAAKNLPGLRFFAALRMTAEKM